MLGLFLVTVLLPVLLVVAVVTDALRWVAFGVPPTAVRLVLFVWVYLAAEVTGVAALATPIAAHRRARRGPGGAGGADPASSRLAISAKFRALCRSRSSNPPRVIPRPVA